MPNLTVITTQITAIDILPCHGKNTIGIIFSDGTMQEFPASDDLLILMNKIADVTKSPDQPDPFGRVIRAIDYYNRM